MSVAHRDYNQNPIVIKMEVEVFVYGEVDNLTQKINQFNNDPDVQETILDLVDDKFPNEEGCGLNTCKTSIIK